MSTKHVTVIGAGIVGLACARALQRDGRQVTLIDPDEPGAGTSFGNAGILSMGSVLPEAMPGILKKIPGMLLDPLGPLSIKWSYLPWLTPHLIRVLRNATPARVEEIAGALASLVRQSIPSYLKLLDDGDIFERLVRRQGCLYLYPTQALFDGARTDNEMRKRHGIKIDILGPAEVKQLIPELGPEVGGGALATESGHVLSPIALSRAFAEAIAAAGGTFIRAKVDDIEAGPAGVGAVIAGGQRHEVEELLICAGAFSKPLARKLGATVPLETERGYHMMLPDPGIDIRLPMLVAGGGFGVTPMTDGLRLAGTVEFGGLRAPPNYARAEVLAKQAKKLLPDLNTEGGEPWMGYRPAMPDSLPVIARTPAHANAYLAFGHGHLGLSLAAVTAAIITDMMAGRTPAIDPTPFRADRF
jgi:D-amino-acid dehydrogenase